MALTYRKLPVISLFSGAGGFDLGLEASQVMETLLCVELENSYFQTLKINQGKEFKGVKFLEKAELINASVLDEKTQARISEITGSLGDWIMVGGPPCQSFSSIGKREFLGDPRGELTPFFLN